MWKWECEDENPKGVIVIVHGAAEHHGRYRWLVQMWKCAGYHVIMGDLPGQGTSTRNRGHIKSFDEYIAEFNIWVKEARKLGLPLFLLGHSMGGLIVIRALQEEHQHINGVILSSPCLGLIFKPNKALELISKPLNILAPSLKVNSGLSVSLATRNKEVRDADENDTLYVTKVSIRWYRELIKAMEQAHAKVKQFPDLPLLVMQGGDDKVVDHSLVRTWFNRAPLREKAYKEWDGFYHEIFNEPERDQVFKYAEAFVSAHLERGT
ncbi:MULTISPECIES: alpha/beta hydrolase [Metabacillus]|uniref:Phospholipase n=1 Tax=Metabacillus indicus TaxID=246786 RepID=A0A084H0W0_METID|nr:MULTISPECIES: alpha/beta hydrolase [Metabacillus]KEZ51414.1 phospholipase [Metabacillus indicus LMG 22858]KEZ53222.1 phospholipase [Metabacillus indicus]MDX8291518.1 alpha/beta hydrolase [Metabacillus indicus]